MNAEFESPIAARSRAESEISTRRCKEQKQ
jgi:hypothetical protein